MSTHGSCNGCGKGFGIFKKETSCNNCGLSFCSKCTDHKIAVPKLNNAVKPVCTRCYNILTGKIKDPSKRRDVSPPANFVRHLQTAATSQQAAPVARRLSGGAVNQQITQDPVVKRYLKPEYRNLSTEDMDIAERLEKLKQDRKALELGPNPLPPIQDVEERLARLRGRDGAGQPPSQGAAAVTYQPPPKSEFEQTGDLFNQMKDEVNLDRRLAGQGDVTNADDTPVIPGAAESNKDHSSDDIQAMISQVAAELEIDAQKAVEDLHKDKEIMARLEELKRRKRPSQSEEQPEDKAKPSDAGNNLGEESDSDNEESQVKHMLQQILEEKRLDEQLEAEGGFKPPLRKEKSVDVPTSNDQIQPDPDELPWCCICNEDAVVRCLDCDMDLYCKRCYNDGHRNLYEDDHRHIPYKKPANSQYN